LLGSRIHMFGLKKASYLFRLLDITYRKMVSYSISDNLDLQNICIFSFYNSHSAYIVLAAEKEKS